MKREDQPASPKPVKTESLGSPYANMLTAAKDHYHGVSSINKYGAIAHSAALARQLVHHGVTTDQYEAMEIARAQVQQLRLQAQGQCMHQLAHQQLQNQVNSVGAHSKPDEDALPVTA